MFDSGVGGISVLRQLIATMPNERYLYLGDSANAPYGVRPVAEVQQLCLNVAEKLVAQGIKAIVIACNTATSVAIPILRETYPELTLAQLAAEFDPPLTKSCLNHRLRKLVELSKQ